MQILVSVSWCVFLSHLHSRNHACQKFFCSYEMGFFSQKHSIKQILFLSGTEWGKEEITWEIMETKGGISGKIDYKMKAENKTVLVKINQCPHSPFIMLCWSFCCLHCVSALSAFSGLLNGVEDIFPARHYELSFREILIIEIKTNVVTSEIETNWEPRELPNCTNKLCLWSWQIQTKVKIW